jgi:dipeptidyl aminopeptidase/acylaminoacyl peptidase
MLTAHLALVLLVPPAPQDPPAATVKLTLEHLLELESVSGPRFSPDGRRIVFTRSRADKVNDARRSELWIVDRDGGRLRSLAEGSSPAFSPDGTRLALIRDGKPRGSQIHVLWLDTLQTTQVTHLDESPSELRWSPDSRQIAFSMLVPETETWKVKLPKPPKDSKWAPEPKVITRLQYRRDGQGYRPQGWRHLFVVDASGGTPRQVTSGDFDHGPGEWTPDGKKLVFSGLRVADADWQWRESELYTVAVEGDPLALAGVGTIEQLTRRKGPDHGGVVSPDGKHLAWLGYDWTTDTYEVTRLHLAATDGRNPRVVTAQLDRDCSGLLWARDSSGVYFSVEDHGTDNVWFAPLQGEPRQITTGTHMFQATDVDRDGALVGIRASFHEPGDVACFADGGFTTLTRVNQDVLGGVKLGKVDEVRCKGPGGVDVQGWLVHPPDFDPGRKYPLILQIHGGPHAMYNVAFDFERHNHAAEGFLLLYSNPRGSTGYGKTFGNAIDNAYPDKDYDDLMAAVDAVIARGSVDDKRLFVYGGSGGGVLTAWIVGHTNRFAGAVSMFPVINWISFVGTTDGASWYRNFERLPWEDIDEHWRRSPLKYAGNVTTPTLFITGELDLRTPMGQTEEMYQALKFRKVDTALVRIQDEYHGAGRNHPSNQMRRILYVREWFQKKDPSRRAPEALPAAGER